MSPLRRLAALVLAFVGAGFVVSTVQSGEGITGKDAISAVVALVGAWVIWPGRDGPKQPRGARTATVNYLLPGPDDEPLTPQEIYVAGINRTGLSGIPRQTLLGNCRRGEPIYLVRQPDNPHDENAVLLYRADGADIGYLPAETAAEIAPRLDAGSPVTATFLRAEAFETDDGRTLLGGRIEIVPHRMRRRRAGK